MTRCPSCGNRYEVDGGFCPVDGLRLVPEAPAPVTSAARGWHGSAGGDAVGPPARAHTGHEPAGPAGFASAGGAAPGATDGRLAAEARARDDPSYEDSLLLGQIVGQRYRIEQRIGCGGMGVVYRASHLAIERNLAIKVLRMQYLEVEDVAERFAQEARVAARIKHPNVVDIIDYGSTAQGAPFFVMEYLAGHSLAYEIDHFGKLEPRRAVALAGQIAAGLGAAHENGIVHRDLKPDNVLLCPGPTGETVKLLDFGIARVLGRASRLTADGAVIGTPEYMSPEQAQGEPVDMRSDLYALGVILFEMLTGTVPFRSDSMVGVLTRQVFDAPPLLRSIEPQLAALPQVERALARLLSKNRDERPQGALDAQALLASAIAADLGSPSGSDARQAAGARPTIAIGSWSVGDTAQAAGAFEVPTTRRGPQLRPPSNHQILRPPQAMGAGSDARSEAPGGPPRAVVVRADTPSRHFPAVPRPSQGGAAPEPARPRRSTSPPLIAVVLIGAGAAVFAGLLTVGVVTWLKTRARAGQTGVGLEQAIEAGPGPMITTPNESAPSRSAPPTAALAASPPASSAPTEPVAAAVSEVAGAAKGDRAEPGARGNAAPKSKTPGGGSAPSTADSRAKAGESVKDPPADPGVSLGDLKDPFL